MKLINKNKIAGIGEVLWDMLPSGKVLGGAPSNFVFNCSMLGNDSVIVSAVGKDELGLNIKKELLKHKINSEFIQVIDNKPTGVVGVIVDEKGIPDYRILDNVAWDYIEYTKEIDKLARTCDAVSFGSLAQRSSLSRETIVRFLKNTSQNCLRVFDMNIRNNIYNVKIIDESLNLCNVLKLNEFELKALSDIYSYPPLLSENELLQKIKQKYKIKYIALTKGAEGSIMLTGNEFDIIKSFTINVVDTIGAGDAFTAGMVHGILNKYSLKSIHSIANQLALFVCSQKGATYNKAELEKFNIIDNFVEI